METVPQGSSLQNSSKIEGHPGIQGVWIVHSKLELHSVERTVYCLGPAAPFNSVKPNLLSNSMTLYHAEIKPPITA